MDLKLLGDLQVYDLPYLSLYMDEPSKTFYLAFRLTMQRGSVCDYVVARVSANRVIDYLQQKVSVREIFRESDRLYMWHKQRGVKGGLTQSADRQLEVKIDDSKYNPYLCEDEDGIRDYLLGR